MEKRGDINPRYTPDLAQRPSVAQERAAQVVERLEKQGVVAQAAELLKQRLKKPDLE